MLHNFISFLNNNVKNYEFRATSDDDKQFVLHSYAIYHLNPEVISKIFKDNFKRLQITCYFKNKNYEYRKKNNKCIFELELENGRTYIKITKLSVIMVYSNNNFIESLNNFIYDNDIYNTQITMLDEINNLSSKKTFRKPFKIAKPKLNIIRIGSPLCISYDSNSILKNEYNKYNPFAYNNVITCFNKNFVIAENYVPVTFENICDVLANEQEKIEFLNDKSKDLFPKEVKLLTTLVNEEILSIKDASNVEGIFDVLKEMKLNNKENKNKNRIKNFYALVSQFRRSELVARNNKLMYDWNYPSRRRGPSIRFKIEMKSCKLLISLNHQKLLDNNFIINSLEQCYDQELVNHLEKLALTENIN